MQYEHAITIINHNIILIKMIIYINLSKQGTQLCRLTILDESVNPRWPD